MSMYFIRKNKTKGFTLIELLVVIAIVGLLSSIVLASLNSARVKARDARRISDLHQIRLALELYYDANGNYPVVPTWISSVDSSWNTLQTALAPYLPNLPKDPVNNSWLPWGTGNYSYSYGYNTASYPNKYDLVAQLEDTNNINTCAKKDYKYHTAGGEMSWCTSHGGYYSDYLYADH
ncbi:MAG: prepilin-type N-terminal cleavage/methylation domain-containing protein [Patescibacteria group bacterium]|nr:prepilin-type N-terminal cleavage/methylation domain-containing protein [Patescibacteria group bacterium]MDE1988510.1 prepilin-type N-terminal cleavage/methylation domain-containing protein [Patescibacteria group bacterium]MDE2217870.1 prepilin-type N-terminal cleavage/methylation domain-containing protein [Patescibacteria group bacterium]